MTRFATKALDQPVYALIGKMCKYATDAASAQLLTRHVDRLFCLETEGKASLTPRQRDLIKDTIAKKFGVNACQN